MGLACLYGSELYILALVNSTIGAHEEWDKVAHNEISARIKSIQRFHSMEFEHGLRSVGVMPSETLRYNAGLVFDPIVISGKSVLDVGAWDGFFSFEAKRRGASRVLATDYYCWSGPGWGTKDGFNLARELLALSIEDKELSVENISPKAVGEFDVVIFSGVFYHLKNPLEALERIAPIAREVMIVETHLDAESYPGPAMVFYPGVELAGDPTNWWGPNPACVMEMLKLCGFGRVSFSRSELFPTRGYFHGYRNSQ